MANMQRRADARWRGPLSWTLQARGNPLRRPVDRKECRVFAGLLVIFLIAGPLAAVISSRLAYGASLREMRTERSWREVTATLLQNAGHSSDRGSNGAPGARASWPAPDGQPRRGIITVDASAKAGQHVAIWVDGAGRQTMSPMSKTSAALSAATLGLAALGVLAHVLMLVGWIVRVAMNRHRLADWETEWRTVEPHWRSPC